MKIKKYPNHYLKQKCSEVDAYGSAPEMVSMLLSETWDEINKPQGLAAPQIGFPYRIILCRLKGKKYIMVNPKILFKFGSRKSNEGCESVEGRYIVRRPIFGIIEYADTSGNLYKKICTWKSIRVVCHEVDHLDGICINEVGVKWR